MLSECKCLQQTRKEVFHTIIEFIDVAFVVIVITASVTVLCENEEYQKLVL